MQHTPPQGDTRSDAELISAVRSGDPSAYGVLFFRHSAAVTTMARYYARDNFTADDLVSEAFERTLGVIAGGGGPDVSFRAYIYTAVRRLAYEQTEKGRKTRVTDDFSEFEMPDEVPDPAVSSFERTLVTGAFAGLPERWQAVLWYIEVEGMSPPEVAPLLGLTANGVSALAYRAREGLRQAYLQAHVVAEPDKASCEEFRGKLGAFARGGLAKRDEAKVQAHLESCEECTAIVAELRDVGHGMRVIIGPLILGGAAAAGLAIGTGGTGATVAAVVALAPKGVWTAGKVLGIAGAVAAVAVVATVLVWSMPADQPLQASPAAEYVDTAAPRPAPSRTPTPNDTPTAPPPTAPPSTNTPRSPQAPTNPPVVPPAPQPQLSLTMAELGDLVRGRDGMVGATLTNSGKGAATSVSFALTLPSGVTMDSARALSLDGASSWSCAPTASGIACSGPALPPGQSVTVYLPVVVSITASGSASATFSSAGVAPQSVASANPVAFDGLGTRFIVDGQFASTTSGASFVSCDSSDPACLLAQNRDASVSLDNNDWPMVALGSTPGAAVSSTTQLTLPTGARVAFAGLYWSGLSPAGDTDDLLSQLQLQAPDGTTQSITAARVDHTLAELGDSYQSFADVTDLVAAGGAGTWTASGARVGPAAAATAGAAVGLGVHAGWSLVVVYEHSALTEGRVTVFDGFEPVTDVPVTFTVAGLAHSSVIVGMVSWEGDAGTGGDSLALDGVLLTRATGGTRTDNAFDATADGSAHPNSFGVDAGAFLPTPLQQQRALLTASTAGDVYTVGVVTVTTR